MSKEQNVERKDVEDLATGGPIEPLGQARDMVYDRTLKILGAAKRI